MPIRVGLVLALLCCLTPSSRAAAEDLSPASVARQSVAQEEGLSEVSARTRSKMTRPGYGVAAGLGIALGGLIVAAQARPNVSYGLCYDDPKTERGYLRASAGFMAGGLLLAGGMLVRLLRKRAAHPELEPSSRSRWGQGLLGFGVTAVTTAMVMTSTIGCLSS